MRLSLSLPAGLAAGLSILSFLSCGSSVPPVVWVVSPSATAAVNDGQTPTSVVVTITQGGTTVPDGTTGTFTFTRGASSASFSAIVAGSSNTTFQGSTSNGQITFQVFDLAVEPVTIEMTADIITAASTVTQTGTQTIHFGGTCSDSFITPASTSSSLSGIPANITLKCNDAVMGGSFEYQETHPYDGNTQSCTALVSDINDQGVAGAAVQFLTEAGAVETDVLLPGQHPTEITDSSGEATVSFHVQAPYPLDVPYSATLDQIIEPAGTDSWGTGGVVGNPASPDTQTPRMWTDSTGHTYNPRDGWVTLIAATAGKPPGGAATLVPDPYVDSDDSGQYAAGDLYIDADCNGAYASVQKPDANGYVRIWTSTTVVWTDLPYPSTGDTADPAAVSAGVVSGEISTLESPANCSGVLDSSAICNYVFRFVDKNANLPSTMLTGNTLTPSSASGCQLTPSGTVALDDTYAEHNLALTDFAFSLTNASVSPPDGPVPYTFTVSGSFNYVDPNEAENSSLNLTSPLVFGPSVSGTCLAPN